MTYPDYFKTYRLDTKHPTSSSQQPIHTDDLNYFVIKRTTPILVRFRYLKLNDGEAYFYQKLLQTVPSRNENDLLGGHCTYREHYLALNPQLQADLLLHSTATNKHAHTFHKLQFNNIVTSLLETLRTTMSPSVARILTIQLDALKKLPPTMPHTAVLQLPEDQYKVLSTITETLGPLHKKKYPYFFITGSAGTGKSYVTNIIRDWLKTSKKQNILVMAPTGIAADNISAQTIHSTLRLTESEAGFLSLAFHDASFRSQLKTIHTIIIDEISMVSAELFTFIANLFAYIHGNTLAFGGINVIVVGDLAQLPPVKGSTVFHSTVWHLFYPLFLHQPKRQLDDPSFFNILQEIRFGNISQNTWDALTEKQLHHPTSPSLDSLLTTTHIVPHRQTADQINRLVCNNLPVENNKFLISAAVDFQNGIQCSSAHSQSDFKSKTNLPTSLHLQQGARVMFLNNSFINEGICNGTIGVVTDIQDLDTPLVTVHVAFCVHGAIVHKPVTKQTAYFYAAGHRASRTQFPLQPAFALTVHKTQSITLPKISIDLQNLFSPGQAYVAISRCKSWHNVHLMNLHKDAFIVDPEVIQEYHRLQAIASKPLSL